jgi:hypothetical protein
MMKAGLRYEVTRYGIGQPAFTISYTYTDVLLHVHRCAN